MGKHEVVKPTSTERVRKHRAEMRAKGFRLKQVWVPDVNDPAFMAEIERANRVIAEHPQVEEDVMAWIEAMNSCSRQDEPDYEW